MFTSWYPYVTSSVVITACRLTRATLRSGVPSRFFLHLARPSVKPSLSCKLPSSVLCVFSSNSSIEAAVFQLLQLCLSIGKLLFHSLCSFLLTEAKTPLMLSIAGLSTAILCFAVASCISSGQMTGRYCRMLDFHCYILSCLPGVSRLAERIEARLEAALHYSRDPLAPIPRV